MTRAPDKTCYTEPERAAIRGPVRALGRDPDTARVIWFNQPPPAHDYRQFGCDEPPGVTLLPGQVTLWTALQRLLVDYTGYGPPPPHITFSQPRYIQRRRQAQPPGLVSAHATETIDPNPQRHNRADHRRNSMVLDLLDIWIGLGGELTGHATEEFLRACLKPVFGKLGIKGLRSSLERLSGSLEWLERYGECRPVRRGRGRPRRRVS